MMVTLLVPKILMSIFMSTYVHLLHLLCTNPLSDLFCCIGTWGFTYIVSCYVLELTWRRQVNTMLFVHHIGTVSMILVFGGELAVSTCPSLY